MINEDVFYGGNTELTIDTLIKVLQKAKSKLGGKTKVVLGDMRPDTGYMGITQSDSVYVTKYGSGYEFAGYPDEVDPDELEDSEEVLVLYSEV